jgi:hypothetical protein
MLIGNSPHKSTVIERIIFNPSVDEDLLTNFAWLEHLNIYVEGT